MDSNHRPPAYQADALTGWAISPFLSNWQLTICNAQLTVNHFFESLSLVGIQSTVLCWLFIPIGGDKRDRTADPLLAKQVLSQLSYTPVSLEGLRLSPIKRPSKLNNESNETVKPFGSSRNADLGLEHLCVRWDLTFMMSRLVTLRFSSNICHSSNLFRCLRQLHSLGLAVDILGLRVSALLSP